MRIKVNQKAIPRGEDFRYGYVENLEGTDLVIWLQIQSTQPMRVEIEPI